MQSERMATWWMHWPDLQWPDSDNLDKIKRRAEGFARANVTAAMFFGAHFRWDFLPVFPLLHDYIATVAEELHKYGIKLFDHHSVNLVHRYSTREEMRRVMQDSGPHLPFSPTFEAAESWQYKGKYLNNWRMLDVKSGKPLWFPQYTAQGFCHRNPEFCQAYQDYAKYLIAETGIDGLSADDAMYFMGFNACGCFYCRQELRRRAGIDLPEVSDTSFWGNWDNPAWHHWIDLRFDASGEFYEQLRTVLPEGFMLTGCGSSSASAKAATMATDARTFLRGWNYVNMELSGNTPPYKGDSKTGNTPIPERFVNASHHQAAAREHGVRAFCTGFAHSRENANIVWAVCKAMGADAWIGTLKTRLGLPWHILNGLPGEEDIVDQAFTFEAGHPSLFSGEPVGQVGVYFSYETRNHTLYGCMNRGYYQDYSDILRLLLREGISPYTVFTFPKNGQECPVVLLSGVCRMTAQEQAAMSQYLENGGKVIALGPTALPGCRNSWSLPTRLDQPPETFFSSVPDGIHVKQPDWFLNGTVEQADEPDAWQLPQEGLFYHPHRLGDSNRTKILELAKRHAKPMPVRLISAEGYLCTMLEGADGITVQLLAEDYDVQINAALDTIRTHRSRVNLIQSITPLGVGHIVRLETAQSPTVYTPFSSGEAYVHLENGICSVQLPKVCAYALLHFPK